MNELQALDAEIQRQGKILESLEITKSEQFQAFFEMMTSRIDAKTDFIGNKYAAGIITATDHAFMNGARFVLDMIRDMPSLLYAEIYESVVRLRKEMKGILDSQKRVDDMLSEP